MESPRKRHQGRKQMRVHGRDFQGQKNALDLQFPVGSKATVHPRTFSFWHCDSDELDEWILVTFTGQVSPKQLRMQPIAKQRIRQSFSLQWMPIRMHRLLLHLSCRLWKPSPRNKLPVSRESRVRNDCLKRNPWAVLGPCWRWCWVVFSVCFLLDILLLQRRILHQPQRVPSLRSGAGQLGIGGSSLPLRTSHGQWRLKLPPIPTSNCPRHPCRVLTLLWVW